MKNKKIILSLLVFLFALFISNICFAGDLDLIKNYNVTIDPRTDGTLDINYHIEWQVLDSTSEGPLTWVKIGIPNSNVTGISSSSSCVKSIKYYNDGGDYVRIDFKKSYYEGDIVKFNFKIHQKNMYTLTTNNCNYSFTPGWFRDIKVENLTVLWNAKNVQSSNSDDKNSDNYLVWNTSLEKGQKLKVTVKYPRTAFNVSESGQAISKTYSSSKTSNTNSSLDDISSDLIGSVSGVITLLIIICVLSAVLSIFGGGGYSRHRGYGYRSSYRSYSSHRSSCACVSSCACACACAGGGRAGCSKKDFYGTNLRTNKLNKVLNK